MQALKTLWSQGGIPRFYQGLAPALIQVSGQAVSYDLSSDLMILLPFMNHA